MVNVLLMAVEQAGYWCRLSRSRDRHRDISRGNSENSSLRYFERNVDWMSKTV